MNITWSRFRRSKYLVTTNQELPRGAIILEPHIPLLAKGSWVPIIEACSRSSESRFRFSTHGLTINIDHAFLSLCVLSLHLRHMNLFPPEIIRIPPQVVLHLEIVMLSFPNGVPVQWNILIISRRNKLICLRC